MHKPISLLTEHDLTALLGQTESATPEFKSGRIFEKPDGELVNSLSEVVSAFANSAGGIIVLGVTDDPKSKDRAAAALDGVDVEKLGMTRSADGAKQRQPAAARASISSCPVRRSAAGLFLIEVPDGPTAYQAQDLRYYGRSEFENRPLQDHDIRLRMQKGHIKRAALEVRRWRLGEYYKPAAGGAAPEAQGIPFGESEHYDRLRQDGEEVEGITGLMALSTFGVGVINTCDRTIRDLTVEIDTHPDSRAQLFIGIERGDVSEPLPKRYRLPEGERLHPGQTLDFPVDAFTVVAGEHWDRSDTAPPVLWTVYVEDGIPTRGEIHFPEIGFRE